MNGEHRYLVRVEWTGNTGSGTSDYKSYSRNHLIQAEASPTSRLIRPAFRGDRTRWNPEDLLVGSLSACHKLWYLHLCAVEGACCRAATRPRTDGGSRARRGVHAGGAASRRRRRRADTALAAALLHERAHHFCYIANSVNFPVLREPRIVEKARAGYRGRPWRRRGRRRGDNFTFPAAGCHAPPAVSSYARRRFAMDARSLSNRMEQRETIMSIARLNPYTAAPEAVKAIPDRGRRALRPGKA